MNWPPGTGSEQLGEPPALITQTDVANSHARHPNTFVLTPCAQGLPVATDVQIDPALRSGLPELSWVTCEQVLHVSKDRLEVSWARLPDTDRARIEAAL